MNPPGDSGEPMRRGGGGRGLDARARKIEARSKALEARMASAGDDVSFEEVMRRFEESAQLFFDAYRLHLDRRPTYKTPKVHWDDDA